MLGKRRPAVSTGQRRRPELKYWALTADTSCSPTTLSKVFGTVNHIPCTILFDTGSTISLISQQLVNQAKLPQSSSAQTVNVLTASCNDMVLNTTTDIPLKIDGFSANHKAFIAPQLVSPIILGTDFLSKFQVSLDFKRAFITIGDTTITTDQTQKEDTTSSKERLWNNSQHTVAVLCDDDPDFDLCSIPQFLPKGTTTCALPSNCSPTYMSIVKEYKSLFSSIPGQTEAIEHHIPTGEAQPIRVPPRRVPMHYKDEIQKQIAEMLQQGIIRESHVLVHGWHHAYLCQKRMGSYTFV